MVSAISFARRGCDRGGGFQLRNKDQKTKTPDPDATRAEVSGTGWRAVVAGPALAVIALVAVIGLIWISVKLVDLSGQAIERPAHRQLHEPLPVVKHLEQE